MVGERPAGARAPFTEAAASSPGELRIAVSMKPPRAVAPPLLGEESGRRSRRRPSCSRSLGHTVDGRDPDWGKIGNQISARYMGGIAEDIDEVPHGDRLERQTRGYRRFARLTAPGWAVRRACGWSAPTASGSSDLRGRTTCC